MIKVLVVEDSPVIREFLLHVLSSDQEIQVVGTANNGEEAVEAVKVKKPDVITMDIHMPKVAGFEATRQIMETQPTPIVIVTGSSSAKEVAATFRATEAGALAVVLRPAGIGHPDHEATAKELVQTVKLMSEVKLVKRWARHRRETVTPEALPAPKEELERKAAEIKLVAIGASTGGPAVIQTILSHLPKDFPAPVLIVQHIASGFAEGLVEWLAQSSGFSTRVATDGEYPRPGRAYIAPDGFQMGVGISGNIALTKHDPENGLRPAVSFLFRSVVRVFGPSAVGILLTGMGKDGAEELRLLKETGAITIVQDKESSVVHGMPGEAIKRDAATYVLSPDKISAMLISLVNRRTPK